MIHELKIATTHFEAWLRGEKTFELRRDDRHPPFADGDELRLREYLGERIVVDQLGRPVEDEDGDWQFEPIYSGRQLLVRVRSVLRDFEGLQPGYAILACTLVENLTTAGRAP